MYMIRVLEGEDVNTPKHVDEQFICRNVVFFALKGLRVRL